MFIYADNAATTKMSRAAVEAMTPYLYECYGNPSSLYALGQRAKDAVEAAREKIARLIGAEAREITFTSGGSEADNQAIRSAAALGRKKGKTHICPPRRSGRRRESGISYPTRSSITRFCIR